MGLRIIFGFLTAFTVSLAVSNPVRILVTKMGALDLPDGRKIHKNPTARGGGLAFFLAIALSLAIFSYFTSPLAVQLMSAGTLIAALGISDDIFRLSAWQKLICQLIISACAWALGARITAIELFGISLKLTAPVSLAVGVLFISVIMNSVNFTDGMDGLASSLGAVIFFALGLLALKSHSTSDVGICVLCLGALLGFLPYNMHKASVFMGDCGSLFLGLALACSAISVGNGSLSAPVLLCLFYPLLELFSTVIRRILRNKSIFAADRGHIHHILYDMGMSENVIALLVCTFSLCFALLAFAI